MTYGDTPDESGNAHDWFGPVPGDYLEVASLRLVFGQTESLWSLDDLNRAAIFAALVDAGLFKRTRAGGYIRADLD